MKAPRASCEGYLTFRTSPSSPPPMLRRYCFLVGTSFHYYRYYVYRLIVLHHYDTLTLQTLSTQEDAYHMLRIKGEVDVLGVQEWDGKGNMHIYQHGLLFATAQSKVFYAYADTAMDKEKWIRAIQTAVVTTAPRLAATFLHHASLDVSTSPVSTAAVPSSETDVKCKCPDCTRLISQAVTAGQVAPMTATLLYKCYSCDGLFCDKFTTHKVPLPHRFYYYAKRVCDRCYEAQNYINYLRAMVERLKAGICLYPKPLNPEAPIELIMPKRPLQTESAKIAIDLLKAKVITAEECEEILLKDRRFYDHTMDHPEIPLDLKILGLHREFRARSFSVYRAVILLHRHLDSDPLLFKPIVEKLLHFSYTRINQVEFYWPQIVHAYLSIPNFDFEKIFWLDELIVSVCSRSIHLALLLRWQLQGALEDSFDTRKPKDMQDKYARVVRLMVEIEREVAGVDRATVLSRDPMQETSHVDKRNLPMPTDDQLRVIVKLTEEIAIHRCHAHNLLTSSSSPSGMKVFSSFSPRKGAGYKESPEGDVESRFRDFSRFQQHLLTPKEDLDSLLLTHPSGDDYEHDERLSILEEEDTGSQSINIFNESMRRSNQTDKSLLAKHFADECDFVEQITDIAEALRFVPSIQERKIQLPSYLEKLHLPPMAYVPLVKATDPFERIVRIPTKEGTAFSTKARVPILLIFEVIRGNPFDDDQQRDTSILESPRSPSRQSRIGSSMLESSEVNYVEDEEIGQLIEHQPFAGDADDVEEVQVETILSSRVISEPYHTPAAMSRRVPLPETPIGVSETVSTPSATPPIAISSPDSKVAGTIASIVRSHTEPSTPLEMDLATGNITAEAIEREKARRKDFEAAFGESWSSKRARLMAASPYGHLPGWDIVSMIGKSNDDLRQEVFTLQLIQKFVEIFRGANLPMWVKRYRIIATSSSTGLIETLINAISLDGLKKREGYVSLLHHFEKSYGPPDSHRFKIAQRKFIQSMAGYSLVCYFLQIKDRHNGNIMLDDEGHIIHIDYGFLLGIAPGGMLSIESAPFKLTAEMVETMGGQDSEGFKEYVTLCTRGFLACQQHCDEICDLVDVMSRQSPYPCFLGIDADYILLRLRSRFKLTLTKQETVAYVLSLIRKSNNNYSTRQYDNFQRMTNGILS
ncbi:putative pleckstrin domain, protein kinase-like domain superfamily, Zinc finger, FYVE/PHD-type [Plasmopara halstedii]